MSPDLLSRINYLACAALFLIGLHGMIVRPNLMRKLMAMNILQVSVILFYLILGIKTGATAPILWTGAASAVAKDYINPLPHALMLTAIVVGVSTTGVALALLLRLHRLYGTLDEREILKMLSEK